MRILYMSDLHLEMERWRLSVPGWPAFRARHRQAAAHPARGPMLDQVGAVDLVVLAGDIHNGLRGIVYAEQVAKYLAAPVVYVAGNHEFYYQDMGRLLPALGTAATHSKGDVTFLENGIASFTLAGRRLNVLGCTLWTDFRLHGHDAPAMRYAARQMNDYAYINSFGALLTPEDTQARHAASRRWLHVSLGRLREREPDALNLVVTHHAPSAAFLGERTGPIAPAYACEALAEYGPYLPAAWIHGHTHFRHDSMARGIRVVSAPRGYVQYDGSAALEYRPGVLEL
jgi:predicted phosphodiesterase